MSSERHTHILVLLGCLLMSLWVVFRQPSDPPSQDQTSSEDQPVLLVTAPQLHSAIAAVEEALPSLARASGNDERLWVTLAQGKTRLGEPRLDLPHTAQDPTLSPSKVVAIALEAGYGLEGEVRTGNDVSSVGSLLNATLRAAAQPLSWHLDALAMAVLSGAAEHRAALGTRTRQALIQLRDAYRPYDRWRGRGGLAPSEREELLRAWRERKGGFGSSHLSYAALRAAAILGEAELAPLADGHLRSLLFRSRRTQSLLKDWVAEAVDPPNPSRAGRILEYEGNLMQALFAAHLRLRVTPESPPSGAIALALSRSAANVAGLVHALGDDTLARVETSALAQALRGLRVARIVLPDEAETSTISHSTDARSSRPEPPAPTR